MEFLIISGMSGAGKSRAADVLEDLDYYCVDNMPAVMLPKFAELCVATRGRFERVALVTDIREGRDFGELFSALDKLAALQLEYRILFMDADLPTIIHRYKETRRRHPLAAPGETIEEAVRRERQLLSTVRERADYVVDTSGFTLTALQNKLYSLLIGEPRDRSINVNVLSFGFKYGLPMESDVVMDVRFLPNPYYVTDLRTLTGLDAGVADYVLNRPDSIRFMGLLSQFMEFILPQYVEEGKHVLTISVGCTGGRHRSVAVAAALTKILEGWGYDTRLINRDIDK